MTRRTLGLLITLVLSYSWLSFTAAAPPGKMPRIGMLALGSPPVQTSPKFPLHIWLAKLTVSRGTHPLPRLVLCPAG